MIAGHLRLRGEDELRAMVVRLSGLVEVLGRDLEGLRAREGERLRAREAELLAELAAERARADALAERVEWLSRRLGKDSSNSSRPPSSDPPFRKPRKPPSSQRARSGRKPGRQPGAASVTLGQVPDPDEDIECPPGECRRCGAGLAGEPVLAEQKRQVFEAQPPPPRPRVTQYRVQAKACPCCGEVTEGAAPAGVTGRAQYGPGVCAMLALLTSWHHVPVSRAAQLALQLAGVRVSAGFAAQCRGRAAALLGPFTDRARELLAAAGVLHADETPVRAAGGLRYLHVACTEFLTALHAGDRTTAGIDAGQVLPGYAGVLVRDGYAGYQHLTGAVHAWCGAHLLRDLKAEHDAGAAWAGANAAVLRGALAAARDARAAGEAQLSQEEQARIRAAYRDALGDGITAGPGTALAMRFGRHEDMILRFTADLAVPFTNNQAERDLRHAKLQQRASGGHWRTLLGLADYAVVRSYLSTAAKWGIDPLDALTRLFTTGPWLPPAAQPG